MQRLSIALAVLACLLSSVHALAWGNKEHIQLTRLAAARLVADPETPPDMKRWLEANTPNLGDMDAERAYFFRQRIGLFPREADGIPFWATIPDMHALTDRPDETVEPFKVHERKLHYLDVEFFHPDETNRAYRHDLSGRPPIDTIPRDIADERFASAGMLPFRVEQCYDKLVAMIKEGRLADAPGQYPRDEHAAKWAGVLAHYVEDNTQPHHATIDYKSQSYFADKRTAPNVHVELEWKQADDEWDDHMGLREEYWTTFVTALDQVRDDVQIQDVWLGSVQTSLNAYDALPLVGLAAQHAAGQRGTPNEPQGPTTQPFSTEAFYRFRGPWRGNGTSVAEMKAHQQALAVDRVARLWRQAWREATGQ